MSDKKHLHETPIWPTDPPDSWVTYHLAHPGPGAAFPGDPNPAFFYKGRYHLHYIYDNGYGFVFGHLSGKDLVHWKRHPTVLGPPTTGHGMFSGTGFFTKDGQPAMIYHGEGSNRNWIAYGLDDDLEKWTEPEMVDPRTADGEVPEMRHWDPDCWRMDDTFYALSGGADPEFMKSNDLKRWEHLGKLLHDDYPSRLGVPRDEDISCANMFPIGNKWMLLCISHPLGCRYYLGDFKDGKYLPDHHAMMNWQASGGLGFFFAPESVLTEDGRRVMWSWLVTDKVHPTGVQALPRELELPEDGTLRIRPLRELESLRYDQRVARDICVEADGTARLDVMQGDTFELALAFETTTAKEYGLVVLCNEKNKRGLRIGVTARTLKAGRTRAPFKLAKGEPLVLRVFVDKNLVEVFANDRQAVAVAHRRHGRNCPVLLFAKGAQVKVKNVTAWHMKPING